MVKEGRGWERDSAVDIGLCEPAACQVLPDPLDPGHEVLGENCKIVL
jgi:hypothetical protein